MVIEEKKAKEFIEEIVSVCKKHNLSLGHEDIGGNFQVHPYDELKTEWLKKFEIGVNSFYGVYRK